MNYLLLALASLALGSTQVSAAYTPDTDCVIQSFAGDYVVNLDSSLDITETIGYDCGSVPGKHGVFRVVPTKEPKYLKSGHPDRTAVTLKSVTDGQGHSYPYSVQRTYDTQTWKVGDPDVTISGQHTYVISYSVSNALAYGQGGKDGLVWNVVGQFWDLPINSASATIHLPKGISRDDSSVSLTSGPQGDTGNPEGATYSWKNSDTLVVSQDSPLAARTGVTLSLLFPSGIVHPYSIPPWKLLLELLSLLLAPYIIWRVYRYWAQYGRDPRMSKVVAPEFAPPAGFGPAELKSLDESLPLQADFLSCTLVDLAVRGYLRIESLPKKETKFVLLKKDSDGLKPFEAAVLAMIFDGQPESLLSEVKKRLSSQQTRPMADLAGKVRDDIRSLGLVDLEGPRRQGMVIALAALCVAGSAWCFASLAEYDDLFFYLGGSLAACVPFLAAFAFLMPRRTPEGAELEKKILGFKLYMKKAEQYRQQFNEKEGIFDRYLPYAIAFGLTGYWIAAMKSLGGAAATSYAPIWWVGYPGGFSFDSLQDQIGSISSSVSSAIAAANTSSSSGGGFSGGGGGGGGGGSW